MFPAAAPPPHPASFAIGNRSQKMKQVELAPKELFADHFNEKVEGESYRHAGSSWCVIVLFFFAFVHGLCLLQQLFHDRPLSPITYLIAE